MNVKTITVKRVKNLGNYQSQTVEMTAEITEMEDPKEATKKLMLLVDEALFPELFARPANESNEPSEIAEIGF